MSQPRYMNENYIVHIVGYELLSSMCNKLSYYASQSWTAVDEAKNEIDRLTINMEGLSNIIRPRFNLSVDEGTSSKHVCDPNLVKTKGKPRKPLSNFHKPRWCSRCKK